MWTFFEKAKASDTKDIRAYLARIKEYEGVELENFFIKKLIKTQGLKAILANDFTALSNLLKNLRNRVLFNEMKAATNQKTALEYMDLISDMADFEIAGKVPVGPAESEYNKLKTDLQNSSGVWSQYTNAEALAKIQALKK